MVQNPESVTLPITQGDPLRFTRISTSDGLSQTRAAIVVQDDRGFLWFGTQYGLNRYDGYSFKLYVHDPRKPNSLGGVYVTSLFKDRNGALWVACAQTLDRFDPVTESFKHFAIDPANPNAIAASVVDISQDASGQLWLATGVGLYSMDPATGALAHFRHQSSDPSSLISNDIKSSREDRSGEFWVGTSEGLDQFDRKTGKVTLHVPVAEPKYVSFYEDRMGGFWIFHASGNGLELLDRKTNTLTHYILGDLSPSGTDLTGVSAMLEDREGNLWLGSRVSGLLKLDRRRHSFIQYRNNPADPDSLADDKVLCLFEDKEGNIWTGLHSSGPNHFNPREPQFTVYKHEPGNPNSLDANFLNGVYQDRAGTLWLASDNCLVRVDRNTGQYTRFNLGLGKRPIVISIAEDLSGSLWIGTYGNGIARLDQASGRFSAYMHRSNDPDSLSSNQVTRIMVDRAGILWAATDDGLSRFDPKGDRFTVYKADPQNRRGQRYTCLAEDANGIIWLGSGYSGLHRFDPRTGRFTVYRSDPAVRGTLNDNAVASVHVDKSGAVWVGTLIGLNKLDPASGRFTSYLEPSGTDGHIVSSILEDEQGKLWMSSNRGLFAFDPNTGASRNYSFFPGLQGNDLSGWGAAFRAANGRMYFGGFAGGISFDPAKLADSPDTPSTVLTDLRLSYTLIAPGEGPLERGSISYADHLTLSHAQNSFSLDFSALSYLDPQGNRYRYRLEGLDDQWREVDAHHRQASYTLLPPRHYIFRVESAASSGKWAEPGVSLPIYIQAAWWQTLWFRSLGGMALLGCLFGVYRSRINAIREREREFRKLAENAPDLVMRLDTKLRFRYINPAVEKLAGIPASSVIGRTHSDLAASGTGIPLPLDAVKDVISQRSPLAREFSFPAASGELCFEARLVPELGGQGALRSVLVIARDVTERKGSVDALRRTTAFLEYGQKLSHTGSIGFNLGSKRLFWSEESARIYGYDPATPPTVDMLLQRVHPEDRSMLQSVFERVSVDGEQFDFEHRLLMPGGGIKVISNYSHLVLDAAGNAEIVGVIMDITERRQTEEFLSISQAKIAHVARTMTVGEFTTSIAHELNQPLAAVVSNADTCLSLLPEHGLDAGIREALSDIAEDAVRASSTIARIRQLAKKAPGERMPISLGDVFQDVVAFTASECARRGVKVRLSAADDVPVILGDRVQLQQLLLNLISNANDAMAETEASLRILTISAVCESFEAGTEVHVAVQDNGEGFAAADLNRLFETFYTTKAQGMGMGLAISRSIAEAHGGRLWATANRVRGATFHFSIPIANG